MTEIPQGARLLGRTGEFADITHDFTGEITIGRSTGNDVVMNSEYLSGRHARIFFRDGEYWIEDLGSRNGTRVDGVAITTPVSLHRVCVITIADTFDLVFVRTFGRTGEPFTTAASASAADPPAEPVSDRESQPAGPSDPSPLIPEPPAGTTMVMTHADIDFAAFVDPRLGQEQAAPTFDLVFDLPDGTQQVFTLKPGANVLGRSEDCDVQLPDPERWLSRRHATVTVTPDGILVADHGSVNGTFVDGQRIETASIEPGVSLRLGPEHAMMLIRR